MTFSTSDSIFRVLYRSEDSCYLTNFFLQCIRIHQGHTFCIIQNQK
eukprot:UN04358